MTLIDNDDNAIINPVAPVCMIYTLDTSPGTKVGMSGASHYHRNVIPR